MEPLSATGIFTVPPSLDVYQTIIFAFFDEEREYFSLVEDVEEYEAELEELATTMQGFLDKEEVVINDERVRPRVVGVHVGFGEAPEDVYISYFIHFKGNPRKGVNYYENIYQETVAEYPISAYWFFHPGIEVIEVEASGDVEIVSGNIVAMHVVSGEMVNGYEKIVFRL